MHLCRVGLENLGATDPGRPEQSPAVGARRAAGRGAGVGRWGRRGGAGHGAGRRPCAGTDPALAVPAQAGQITGGARSWANRAVHRAPHGGPSPGGLRHRWPGLDPGAAVVAYTGFQSLDVRWDDPAAPGRHWVVTDHPYLEVAGGGGHRIRARPGTTTPEADFDVSLMSHNRRLSGWLRLCSDCGLCDSYLRLRMAETCLFVRHRMEEQGLRLHVRRRQLGDEMRFGIFREQAIPSCACAARYPADVAACVGNKPSLSPNLSLLDQVRASGIRFIDFPIDKPMAPGPHRPWRRTAGPAAPGLGIPSPE